MEGTLEESAAKDSSRNSPDRHLTGEYSRRFRMIIITAARQNPTFGSHLDPLDCKSLEFLVDRNAFHIASLFYDTDTKLNQVV